MNRFVRLALMQLLLIAATLGGTLSMRGLVDPASWLTPTATVLVITSLAVGICRALSRSIWLPTAIGVVVGLVAIGSRYAPGERGLGLLPGRESPGELRALVEQGVIDAAQSAPVLDSAGLGLVITASAVGVYLLAELVAVGARAPAWSGVSLLVPWVPAVTLQPPVGADAFVIAAIGYLGTLAIHSADSEVSQTKSRRTLATVRAGGMAAALAVVVALISAPLVLQLPTGDWEGSGAGGSGATRLNLGLDVSEDLIRGSDETIYTYQASDPETLGPLHAYTLTDFNGVRWQRDDEPADTEPVESGQPLWSGEVPGEATGTLSIEIDDLDQDRLLLPGQPRALTLDGDWAFDSQADEVIGTGPSPLSYTADIYARDLDPERLNEAELDGVADQVDPATLAVPQTGQQQQIQALAQRVADAEQATTPYQQAVAIQDYLRFGSEFSYELEVDEPRTDDAVWDFLGSGRGYCVQFATAMIVMARTLDIPARMAVGYLEGTERPDGSVTVSAQRAHAWPQLYFEGAGWVRFEPTPSSRAGAAPEWAEGLPGRFDNDDELIPENTAPPIEEPLPPDDQPTGVGTESPAQEQQSTNWGWVVGLVVAVLLVVLYLAWGHRRSSRRDIEAVWSQISKAAAPIRPEQANPGETPRRLVQRVALSGEAAQAVEQLLAALEKHRYAPPGGEAPDVEEISRWREHAIAGIRDEAKS